MERRLDKKIEKRRNYICLKGVYTMGNSETYKWRAYCTKCGAGTEVNIPRGTSIADYFGSESHRENRRCPNCGFYKLTPVEKLD